MSSNKFLVLSQALQATLDVFSRWRWFPFFSRLIFRDWLHLRRLFANQLNGCHDLREPRTFSLRPEIGTLSSSEVAQIVSRSLLPKT